MKTRMSNQNNDPKTTTRIKSGTETETKTETETETSPETDTDPEIRIENEQDVQETTGVQFDQLDPKAELWLGYVGFSQSDKNSL